jgi:hypothetical protein
MRFWLPAKEFNTSVKPPHHTAPAPRFALATPLVILAHR